MKKAVLLLLLFTLQLAIGQSYKVKLVRLSSSSETTAESIICQHIDNDNVFDVLREPENFLTHINQGRSTRNHNVNGNPNLNFGDLVRVSSSPSDDEFGYFAVTYIAPGSWSDEDETIGAGRFTKITLDCDNDGISNENDNCVKVSNSNQADLDDDGKGDACDNVDNRDSDGDGVENFEDDCPNEFGLASNNGCPGNIDLSIDLNGSTIVSNCFNCAVNFSNIGSDRHILYIPSGTANIDVRVRNTGNVASASSTVGFYVSANNTFEARNDTRVKSFNLSAVNANGFRNSSGTLFVDDFDSISGNFWLLVRVDDAESNQESDEDNNVFAMPFSITTPQIIIPPFN